MKRNLKLLNHWIAELREIATKADLKIQETLDEKPYPITKNEIKKIFCINKFEVDFTEGLTPQQAFDNELDSLVN
jgi:signal recognition particle subunit SEC65